MSDAFKPLLARLADGATLSEDDAQSFFAACLRGEPIITPGLSNRVSIGLVQLAPRRWATAALGWAYRRGQR